jgi:hypothetical protein
MHPGNLQQYGAGMSRAIGEKRSLSMVIHCWTLAALWQVRRVSEFEGDAKLQQSTARNEIHVCVGNSVFFPHV